MSFEHQPAGGGLRPSRDPRTASPRCSSNSRSDASLSGGDWRRFPTSSFRPWMAPSTPSSTSTSTSDATTAGVRVDGSTQWCLELLAQKQVATVMGGGFRCRRLREGSPLPPEWISWKQDLTASTSSSSPRVETLRIPAIFAAECPDTGSPGQLDSAFSYPAICATFRAQRLGEIRPTTKSRQSS